MTLPLLTASNNAEPLIFNPQTTLTASHNADTDTPSRTVSGVIVPWGTPGYTSVGLITAQRGSIQVPADTKHLKLFRDHSDAGGTPVGYATKVEDTDQGLVASFHIADTPDGDTALKDIKEGVRDALSMEIIGQEISGDLLTAGQLTAVAIVAVPAFSASRITQVTASHQGNAAAGGKTGRLTMPPTVTATPRTTPLTAGAIYDALCRLDDPTADQTLLTAALKQMKVAESPLLTSPQWIDQLWDGQPYKRLFVDKMTHQDLTGLKLEANRWKTRPTVDEWNGSGTDVPSNEASFEVVEVQATRLAGANKLPVEWIHFKKVNLIEQYFLGMAEDYAVKSDNKALADAIAQATEKDLTAQGLGLLEAIPYANHAVYKAARVYADAIAVNDEDWLALSKIKQLELPALMETLKINPDIIIPTDQVAKGKIFAWPTPGIIHGELPGSPIRAEALDIAKGQVDDGVFGYRAVVVARPDALGYVKFKA